MNDRRSLIGYFKDSSLMLYNCCNISILNSSKKSASLLLALLLRGLSGTCSGAARTKIPLHLGSAVVELDLRDG